ncbi:MAG: hypothetical protein ACO3X1_15230 [Burkholderiaceae bacterium]
MNLKSESGVAIAIDRTKWLLDRSTNKPLKYVALTKMTFTVKPKEGTAFDEKTQMRAVVVQKMWKDNMCGLPEPDHAYEVPHELDLVRQDAGSYQADMFQSGFYFRRDFSGQLVKEQARRMNLVIDGYYDYHSNKGTEMALVIDGNWQTDPINKSNNFVLSFR